MDTENTTGQPDGAIAKPAKKGIIKTVEAAAEKVGSAIGKEARTIASAFAKEEPIVQSKLTDVSKYVQIIKTTLTEDPAVVTYLLKQVNTSVTSDEINDLLTKASVSLKLIAADAKPTLIETIKALQENAASLPDENAHNAWWTSLFSVLGILVSPSTPWSKVVQFGILIYNTVIKPKGL